MQFKLQVLSHQDREQLSSRRVAALYDIQDPTKSWPGGRNFAQRRLLARDSEKEDRLKMKLERRYAEPSTTVADDAT